MGKDEGYIKKFRKAIKRENKQTLTDSIGIDKVSDSEQAVQDIFADFVQKLYHLRLDNYLKVKNTALDQVEIVKAFFGGDDQFLLKKLIISLFVPFYYVNMSVKERELAEDFITDLYANLENLRLELTKGNTPLFAYRSVVLKDQVDEDKINQYLEQKADSIEDEEEDD